MAKKFFLLSIFTFIFLCNCTLEIPQNSPNKNYSESNDQTEETEQSDYSKEEYIFVANECYNYTLNAEGNYFLSNKIVYDPPKYENSTLKYNYKSTTYDNEGRETTLLSAIFSSYKNINTLDTITEQYSYENGIKKLAIKNIYTSTYEEDEDLRWVTNSQSTTRTIVIPENSETIYQFKKTCEKENCGIVNNKKCYTLHFTETTNDSTNKYMVKVFVDNSGFNCETITYNSDASVSNHSYAQPLPNAPVGLQKSTIWTKIDLADLPIYTAYDTVCNVLINNEEEYKFELITTYKLVNDDTTYGFKYVWDYKKFKI